MTATKDNTPSMKGTLQIELKIDMYLFTSVVPIITFFLREEWILPLDGSSQTEPLLFHLKRTLNETHIP